MGSIATTWGSTAAEREQTYPCDALVEDADTLLYRAITVDAPPAVVFRWLCQLRVAPYSYDWIDNFGKESPRVLTPGLERLERGQRVMRIFELVDFEVDRHLTMVLASRGGITAFGELALSYVVAPHGGRQTRLVAKLRIESGRGVFGRVRGALLAWGDLVMMRKQLMTLSRYSAGLGGAAAVARAARLGDAVLPFDSHR